MRGISDGKRRPHGRLLQPDVAVWVLVWSVDGSLRSSFARNCGGKSGTPSSENYIANLTRGTPFGGQLGWGGTPLKRYQGRPKVCSSESEIRSRAQGQKQA